jgi:hypothetical protein
MEPRFSEDGAVIYLVYDEAPTVEEWIEAFSALETDPRGDQVMGLIADRSRVAPPSVDFVRGVVNHLGSRAEMHRGLRMALIVRDPASLGMGRMGQILLEPHAWSFEIFDDMAKAEAWVRGGDGSGIGQSADEG